jgi:hypothetical protein
MSFQEFQKAPNKLTSGEIVFLIVAGIIIVLVLYGLAVGNYTLAGQLPDGGEFTLLRTGGRAFLFDRLEPYSGGVPALVQEQVYGRPANSGEDPYILDIPFHLLIFFFPLALFPDTLMARAFWMALSEIALAGFLYFTFRLMDRRISYIFIGLLSISGFISFYPYLAIVEGSPVILLGLVWVAILVSLQRGQDEIAGLLMLFSAFQWEVSGLFLLFVALWVFWEKRWRVYAGAGMLAVVLLTISFLWYPGWLIPFLRASWNSFQVGFGFSTHELLKRLWPQFGDILGWALTATLVVTLGYQWRAARQAHFSHFIWVVCLTLAATPLLGHHVEMDQLFPITLPIMFVVVVARERWKKLGDGIGFLLLWFFFGLPWLFYLQGVPEWIALNKNEALFLFWPIFSVLGLFWMRWWMIRAPRTWLDNLSSKERG